MLSTSMQLRPSSPRTWGCFCRCCDGQGRRDVFPTYVWVFLRILEMKINGSRLPHVRGGVSGMPYEPDVMSPSSPRTWGCFLHSQKNSNLAPVFPTYVGVFLVEPSTASPILRLPHVRGGVSIQHPPSGSGNGSSPRTWGCFCVNVTCDR